MSVWIDDRDCCSGEQDHAAYPTRQCDVTACNSVVIKTTGQGQHSVLSLIWCTANFVKRVLVLIACNIYLSFYDNYTQLYISAQCSGAKVKFLYS